MIHAEFWSSTEYRGFLWALTREVTALGMETTQRFAVGEHSYRAARTRLERLQMRWRTYGVYPWQLRRHLRSDGRPAIAVICTNTFYAPWVGLRSRREGGPAVVHWVLDLFPDVLIAAGKLRSGSWAERRLRRLVRSTFDGAAANVFLGERLRVAAEQRFGPIPRCCVIAVGADGAPFRSRSPEKPMRDGMEVLYCGNLGRMHDTDTIASLFDLEPITGVRWVFRANGASFGALKNRVRAVPSVTFAENLPENEWVEAMCAADIALVTMKPGAEAVVMPSKTYSALVAGQAVLAICPTPSDLADLVRAHDCGWVVAPGDVEGLRATVERLARSPDEILAKRRNAWRAGHEHYDQRVLARQWADLFRRLEETEP